MLNDEQARFAARQFSRWLQIKETHEQANRYDHESQTWQSGSRWGRYEISFLKADIDHSALLYRLLRGRDPLPEPPPKENAYPAYPDWPYDEPASLVGENNQ